MTITLEAIYDGEVLRPIGPIDLEPNTRVIITFEANGVKEKETRSFLQTARSLNLEGPPDWSEKIEDYLYGDQSGVRN
jgi:predicted DNA-binding antitoxin AbrB/MazE fold protein